VAEAAADMMLRTMTALERVPGKIVAVHASYRSRAAERGTIPPWPSYFLKPSSSLAGSGDPVARPPGCELLAFEGEVALVIGQRARRVGRAQAWDCVAWITAANDFGVYDLRYADRGSTCGPRASTASPRSARGCSTRAPSTWKRSGCVPGSTGNWPRTPGPRRTCCSASRTSSPTCPGSSRWTQAT